MQVAAAPAAIAPIARNAMNLMAAHSSHVPKLWTRWHHRWTCLSFQIEHQAECHDVTHPALFSWPFSGMMIGPPQGDGEPAKLAGRLVLGGPNRSQTQNHAPLAQLARVSNMQNVGK
jgi:hypothetical protein